MPVGQRVGDVNFNRINPMKRVNPFREEDDHEKEEGKKDEEEQKQEQEKKRRQAKDSYKASKQKKQADKDNSQGNTMDWLNLNQIKKGSAQKKLKEIQEDQEQNFLDDKA